MNNEELPAYLEHGFLTVNKVPLYYVERYSDSDQLTVYGVKREEGRSMANGTPYYDKDYTIREKQTLHYHNTVLGNLLNKQIKDNHQTYKMYKAPLFVADIKMGTDSFDGKYKVGFEERLPDKIVMNKAGVPVSNQHQQETGVFIGLDKIKWDEPELSIEELMRVADSKRNENSLWSN